MIFLILGILFLLIGIPLSFGPYRRVYSMPDKAVDEFLAYSPHPYLFLVGGCLVMLLDIAGVVFILIYIFKKIL